MKVGIIGLGFVGLSLASVLGSKSYFTMGFDSDKKKLSEIKNGKPPFYEPRLDETLKLALRKGLEITNSVSTIVENCQIIFVTVGTPQREDGSINLSMIKSVVGEIGKRLKNTKNKPIIVIKSTVVPGTALNVLLPILVSESRKKLGKNFGLITNPEFLRESMAINDTINPHMIVLGGAKDRFMNTMKRFYENLHRGVPITITNNQTAEMIKYTNNSFLATKISFINQISNICQLIPGANVEEVARTIGLDPRIGYLFLNAGPGYGGSCLPKDVAAIINFSKRLGINPLLLDAVKEVNDYQLKHVILIIKKSTGNLKNKKIAVLGLAFKPDTDDIRDSVSIKLIHSLLKQGAVITVHDPKAIENTRNIFKGKISYARSLDDALRKSQCCVIMTPWKEYSKINETHLRLMEKRVIVDTRRILNDSKLKMKYYPIGIG